MLKNLEKLGFYPNEAKIYLALLELGFCSTAPIIKKTGLHRNIVYEALDRLIQQGFVATSIQKNKKHFRVLSPEKILQQEEARLEIAQNLVTELTKLQKRERQEVIIYEGKDGFQGAHLDAIKQMEKGSVAYIMRAGGKKWTENMADVAQKLDRARKEKNIKIKLLALQNQKKELGAQVKRPLLEIKFLAEKLEAPVGTAIYGNIVLNMIYGDPVLIIMIKNSQLATGFKQYFDIFWKMAS